MKVAKILVMSLLGVFTVGAVRAEVSVIPRPIELIEGDGSFTIAEDTKIIAGEGTGKVAVQVQNLIEPATGHKLAIESANRSNSIKLRIYAKIKDRLGSEGYRLKVDADGVSIIAATETGLFYGVQTLRQLLPVGMDNDSVSTGKKVQVPFVRISDKPRFGWRGYMLDESRYFKGEKVVKSILDQMAMHKMNVFHWHLTDDQGWRIEIKKYPKLTEIGSKRKDSQIGGWNSEKYSGKAHGGFYTQDQIRDIVKYAAQRHITIVPEIEMPGHATAAIASYSWLGTSGKEIEVSSRFGKHEDSYNVADAKVIGFIEDVLLEVMDLFPSKVIHVGGDEVKYDHWKDSEYVKKYMTKHGLKTPADLQIHFTNRISRFMKSKGRRMMGWNEILGHKLHEYQDSEDTQVAQKLADSTIVHFWKGNVELAEQAASQGYDIVNSYHVFTYLDYGYNNISVEKAYSFDPVPAGLDKKYHSKIKGLGCQMWGEWIPTVERMEKQTYPRLSAYAEVGWTDKDRKDYKDFARRLETMKQRWDTLGIQYTD